MVTCHGQSSALVAVVRGANCPLLIQTITDQLAHEHKVLEGMAERKEVRKNFSSCIYFSICCYILQKIELTFLTHCILYLLIKLLRFVVHYLLENILENALNLKL